MAPRRGAVVHGMALVLLGLTMSCLSGCAQVKPANLPDSDALDLGRQILIRDCMRHAGFEYRVTPRPIVPDDREFPYVIDDVGWARKHGYGTDIQRSLDALRLADPNKRYFNGLPAERRSAALAAANGAKPTGMSARDPGGMTMTRSDQGCQTGADRELFGDPQAWFQAEVTVRALEPIRVGRVTADPQFAAAARPWSACMQAGGYPYVSPVDLRDHLPPPEKPLPFADEQRMAVAEATCAVDSGLATTAKTLDARHDALVRQQYQADLDTEQRLRQAALPRARELVRRAGLGS
jgi:hypothetical protein